MAGNRLDAEAGDWMLKFSAVIIAIIAVIISGRFIARFIEFRSNRDDFFSLNLWIFQIAAHRAEIILGLTFFIIMLLLVGFIGGAALYEMVHVSFGVNLGQFNTLCFISALLLLLGSFTVYIIMHLFAPDRLIDESEHEQVIRKIKNKNDTPPS